MSSKKEGERLAAAFRAAAVSTNQKLRKTMALGASVVKGLNEQKRRDLCKKSLEKAEEILGMLEGSRLEKASNTELVKMYQILTQAYQPLAEDIKPAEEDLASMSDEELAREVAEASGVSPN